MEASVRPIVQELAADLRRVLGDTLVGLYLFGSSVSGDFEPDASDIDLIAVTAVAADRLDLGALRAVHDRFVAVHTAWLDRVEVVYIGRRTLREFRFGGALAVISPGEPFHLRNDAQDWLQSWYLVRETAEAIVGPEPSAVVPAIPAADFLAALRRYVEELRSRDHEAAAPGARAYAVLTVCRAWRTLATGGPCSKREGADWARARLPERGSLIDAAVACRRSHGTVGFDSATSAGETAAFVGAVADLIRSIPS